MTQSSPPSQTTSNNAENRPKRIGIYVVAVDAASSLASVLDRIPTKVRERVEEVFVFDAGSRDDTYLVGVGYKAVSGFENLKIMRGDRGGLGANNKRAFEYCREQGFDIVVLLHADGKYAPEVIEDLIRPLERGEVDAVIGSRMLAGRPPRSAYPITKYAAIRVLGGIQNRLLGLTLSDHHCGYRAYSVPAISELPIRENSDGLQFDSEILIQILQKGLRIVEVPVPVYSGEEVDSTRGVTYAYRVLRVLWQLWLHQKGIREQPKFAIAEKYVYRSSPNTSHQVILGLVDRDNQRMLDVGCGAGYLAEALRVRGNSVVGVDERAADGVHERVTELIETDLDREPIPWEGDPFDYVVMADILEHLRDPQPILKQCDRLLTEDGAIIVSVPNVAHWSARISLLLGRFAYTSRGIFDRSHLRFYTLASIRAEIEAAGFEVERVEATIAPLDELLPEGALSGLAHLVNWIQVTGNRIWKELFAYQVVLRARRVRGSSR